ncbi:MAG: peptidoglycan D,D-transpeptidase FtsI family protein [Campylobacterota bacterium]
MSTKNTEKINKTKKIAILFILIFLALLILIISVTKTIADYRRLPTLNSSKNEMSVRGEIISADNFKIATSKKLYKASIDTRHLAKDKKELFLKLFSVYSRIPYEKLEKRLNNKKTPGNLVLSYSIDSRTAKNLKELAFKLRKLDVFISREVHGGKILRGLNIVESGEKRIFSYKDTLTPVIGYIRKYESKKGKTRVKGIKGLEKSYDTLLNESKDGILKGNRDVLSYISFDKNSIIRKRVDGAKLKLNIPLKLQKNIELILDKHKKKLQAAEIMVSIIESKTGKVLSLASSNRFDPENIRQEDIPSLNVSPIEYQFEPGSILKPISISLVMDKGRIDEDEKLFAHNEGRRNKKGEYPRGRYKLDRYTISDDHRFKKNYLSLKDIVIYSSNIGTLKYAQRLTGQEFYNGLIKFGLTKETGIDLPYEREGVMPKVWQFAANDEEGEDNVFKATVSYGQGMTSTFMQMIKAYTVFNNNGQMVTPKIVSELIHDDKVYRPNNKKDESVISKQTANKIKNLLIKTVKKGTGKSANIEGLEIGGKTGTAQIAERGEYQRKYISSFFGFVNDKNNKSYTIGVTVREPISTGKNWYYYYASSSAVPVFKETVETLVKLNYLTVDKNKINLN